MFGSLAAVGAPPTGSKAVATGPDFNREVRPILSRHCFKCHGPDDKQRMAGLRLDGRAFAIAPLAAGRRAVIPGKPLQSELIRRVVATDARVMPPAHTKNPLTTAQQEVLKRWVAAGAPYAEHWSFVPPQAVTPPKVRDLKWPRNPIDNFILARLEKEGLRPSPEADRHTLVRRVYLDLIGLPPTPEEADQFLNDRSPDAYEKLVDRLLASSHYGERWARRWLDLARYADTNGYEKDRSRSIWPYRDWVINALNADMPFNQFTVEQIAGDMLPNATLSQRIATGFHRNTMLNEEGGIDPLEYRFHAMTDRVSTTATTWLGLTVGCAQCHTHKFDPIPHKEYYRFFALLNNTEEPEIEVPQPELVARRAEIGAQVAARERELPTRFPAEGELRWTTPTPTRLTAEGGALLAAQSDDSILASGPNPERNTYSVTLQGPAATVTALRLEAIPHPSLGAKGPGRTPHGNFVLSEIRVRVSTADAPDAGAEVKLSRAQADFSQDTFPVANAIDGKLETGWAIHGPDPWNVLRTATFHLLKPESVPASARWTIELVQNHGIQHTLGSFRLSLGERVDDGRPLEVRRKENLERKFAEWRQRETARAVKWTVLRPSAAKSNLPLLTVQPDDSVIASGDMSKRDVYDLSFRDVPAGVTALRLEAIPDARLPKNGPGRIYYEGPFGDFFLSEVELSAAGKPVKLAGASQTFAGGGGAATALDRNPQTGWSVNGGQGQAHSAVFNLAEPLADPRGLNLQLIFERYFAAGLGRFRVSVTTDPRPAQAVLPPAIEALLLKPATEQSGAEKDQLLRYYASVAPELAGEREEIRKLSASMPALPTTLVMAERPPDNPRLTYLHNRGEFLQPRDRVEPGVLTVLHDLPPAAQPDRLSFGRWLVDPRNPLVGRVTVNRQWAAFFGTGIVKTTEDFGYQGDSPSHPELLDWLAIAFTSKGDRAGGACNWSLKSLHRLIVTSATYRQSSAVTPALLARDAPNRLIARGPRFRMEAEQVRDAALTVSGLLTPKLGGPSVFPPQPAGVTSEGTYGPLTWKVSEGPDRYRRALYTFTKRTAPFAMALTFDAPSGEACVARREVSNTPLQALTLLNDTVFVEAAQALGRMLTSRPGSVEERASYLFRRAVTRPATIEERALLVRFFEAQKTRLIAKELNAAAIAGPGEGDAIDRAAWTLLARSVLNLDETITKE